ncbi:MAG: hypothetical protein ABJE47_18520 [bacterium]
MTLVSALAFVDAREEGDRRRGTPSSAMLSSGIVAASRALRAVSLTVSQASNDPSAYTGLI